MWNVGPSRQKQKEGSMAMTGAQIRKKVMDLYPEIEKFNLQVSAEYNDDKGVWVVTLENGASS